MNSVEQVMDALSKLVEKWREPHEEYIFKSAHHMGGWHQGRVECAKELEKALAALRPVIEKLVECGQVFRDQSIGIATIRSNELITTAEAQANWDAALESWRMMNG